MGTMVAIVLLETIPFYINTTENLTAPSKGECSLC